MRSSYLLAPLVVVCSGLTGCMAPSPAAPEALPDLFAGEFAPLETAAEAMVTGPAPTEVATLDSDGHAPAGATNSTVPAETVERAAAPMPRQGQYGPVKGDSLVSAALSFSSRSDKPDGGSSITTDALTVQGAVGYFLTSAWEAGVQLLGSFIMPDSGSDTTFFTAEPYVNYNIPTSNNRVWIYFGPHLGLFVIDAGGSSAESFSIGAHGGGRFWLDATTAVFGELRYTYSTYDFGGPDIESNDVILLFGFSLAF